MSLSVKIPWRKRFAFGKDKPIGKLKRRKKTLHVDIKKKSYETIKKDEKSKFGSFLIF